MTQKRAALAALAFIAFAGPLVEQWASGRVEAFSRYDMAVTLASLPIYFVRSRGWKRGRVTILLAALFFGILLALGEAASGRARCSRMSST